MITETTIINGQTWTITGDDRPNVLSPTPRITGTVNGVTVGIDCQYRQITSISHNGDCTWGICSPCTCAPVPSDPTQLFGITRDVLYRALKARNTAEDVAEHERSQREMEFDTPTYRVLPGCDCPSAAYGGVCTCC